MMPAPPRPGPTSGPRTATPVAHVARDLAFGALPLALVTTASSRVLGLEASYWLAVGTAYLLFAGIVASLAPRSLPGPGLGAANRVTLGRFVLALPVAGLVVAPGGLGATGAWWAVALSAIALALDGLDGRIARATGTSTAFGARLDMEVDAFLILALSVLVWTSTSLGTWVVAIGAMRYVFVAAGAVWTWLRAPLPPSRRRQTVCVVQILALLVCLSPLPSPAVATLVAAAALVALLVSFGLDVRWLYRRRRTDPVLQDDSTPA